MWTGAADPMHTAYTFAHRLFTDTNSANICMLQEKTKTKTASEKLHYKTMASDVTIKNL